MTQDTITRADVAKAVGRLLCSPQGRKLLTVNEYRPGLPMLTAAPEEPLSVLVEWSRHREEPVLVATIVGGEPVILRIDPAVNPDAADLNDLLAPGMSTESTVGLFAEYIQSRSKREKRQRFTVKFSSQGSSSTALRAAATRVHAMA